MILKIRIKLSNIILILFIFTGIVGSWGYTSLTYQVEFVLLATLLIYLIFKRGLYLSRNNEGWVVFWIYVLLRSFASGALFSLSTFLTVIYILLFLVKFNSQSDQLLIKLLKIIGIAEAVGVYLQFFINDFYNIIYQAIFTDYAFSWILSRYQLYNYLSGFTSEVSKVAGFLGFSLGAFVYEIHDLKKEKINIICAIFILIALILTGKRSQTFFSLFGILVVYFISATNRKRAIRLLKIAFCVSIASCIMLFVYFRYGETNAIGRMIAYIFSLLSGEENTFGGRAGIWSKALYLFYRNPFFGIGWNQFTNMIERTLGEVINSAHNVYLQILCELGLVGFVLFVYAVVQSIYICIRKIKNSIRDFESTRNYKLLLYLCVYYFSYCFFGNCLNDISYSMIFFTALVILLNKEGRIESKCY